MGIRWVFKFGGASLLLTGVALCALGVVSCAPLTVGGGTPSASLERMRTEELVKRSAQGLADAYQDKDIRGFMSLVSERFTGDDSMLETDVRHDFSAYADISVRLTVDSVTIDASGMSAYVAVTFTRDVTDAGVSGRVSSDGSTFLVFRLEDGVWRLYSMGMPFIFE